jgi:hypothetical protein
MCWGETGRKKEAARMRVGLVLTRGEARVINGGTYGDRSWVYALGNLTVCFALTGRVLLHPQTLSPAKTIHDPIDLKSPQTQTNKAPSQLDELSAGIRKLWSRSKPDEVFSPSLELDHPFGYQQLKIN